MLAAGLKPGELESEEATAMTRQFSTQTSICAWAPFGERPARLLLKATALVGVAALMAGCVSAGSQSKVDRDADKVAAFYEKYEKTGETERCLLTENINEMRAITDSLFFIRYNLNAYYINDLGGNCNGASQAGTVLAYTTSGAELCRNDLVRVVDLQGGFSRSGCGISDFEAITLKPTAKNGAAPSRAE